MTDDLNTYTGFIAWAWTPPNAADEEIDVRARNEGEARQMIQKALDTPGAYEPGGRIVHVEERFGLFF